MMALDGFDWEAGNRDKCRKHGVTPAEIEALVRGAPRGLRGLLPPGERRATADPPDQCALHACRGGEAL
jgi:hypothetical protein